MFELLKYFNQFSSFIQYLYSQQSAEKKEKKKKYITISNIKTWWMLKIQPYSIFYWIVTEVDRMILVNYVILKSGVECKQTV